MNPDPWAGALIIASDQEKLHTQKIKVLGESHTENSRLGTDSDLGMAAGNQWLTHTCRSLWNLASAIPAETPVLVVENFLQVMEDNLLNALILAVENSTAPSTVDGHRGRIIIDWIDTHFSEPLTVADLAAAVALSVRQLQACVQDQFSMTPIELLTDVRLSKLHSALLTSDSDQRTVASLMYSVGFTHLGRTSQIYREKYGESPSHTLKRSMHG
jgi:AraC-like DNA-binding protein